MTNLIIRRLIQLPLLILVIYTVTFLLAWVMPGNPLSMDETRRPSKEIEEKMLAQYNLDSGWSFYWNYIYDATGIHYAKKKLTGEAIEPGEEVFNFGPSLKYRDWRVSDIIADGFPVSVQLGVAAILLALLIGVTAGVIGAVRRDTIWDNATLGIALIGISVPNFVVGSFLLIIFSLNLRWLPVGWGTLEQMILPTVTLSLPFAAYIARLTRLGMLDVLNSDFIRTARAKGLDERKVIIKHALKVAFLPVLSFLGPAAAGAITGSFVIEQVFNIPGMGQHFVAAVQNKDLFLIMGVVLLFATLLILFNLLVDLAYGLVDPRIEHA